MLPRGLLWKKEVSQSWFEISGEEATDRIVRAKAEAEPVGFVEVERIGVKNADVHLPFFEVLRRCQAYAGRKGLMNLEKSLGSGSRRAEGEWERDGLYLGKLLVVGDSLVNRP